MFKRILLFLSVNFLIVMMISAILSIFNVQPYLSSYGLNYKALLIFCLIWGMGGAFISLAISRKMAKWMMGVQVVGDHVVDAKLHWLVTTVHALSRKAGLREMPEVGFFQSNAMNAFATGPTKTRALVAVSSGILYHMSEDELEAVIGHEITHIANGDMVTMTLLQGIVNAFVMFLARIFAYALMRNNKRGNSGSYLGYIGLVWLFEIVFMLLGSTVVCAFSRWREFRADRGGADLAGKEKMIAALQRLQMGQQEGDAAYSKQSAIQALMINRGAKQGIMARLFSTHPPLDQRIDRLRER